MLLGSEVRFWRGTGTLEISSTSHSPIDYTPHEAVQNRPQR